MKDGKIFFVASDLDNSLPRVVVQGSCCYRCGPTESRMVKSWREQDRKSIHSTVVTDYVATDIHSTSYVWVCNCPDRLFERTSARFMSSFMMALDDWNARNGIKTDTRAAILAQREKARKDLAYAIEALALLDRACSEM